jgi:transcriptional antiterminator
MSSTDLANEETKLSIKAAEKEALEHSILQRERFLKQRSHTRVYKILKVLNGEVVSLRERECKQEEEERRDRERLARLRQAQEQQCRASIASGSIPPESPIIPHTPTWGGPSALLSDATGHSRCERTVWECRA